MRVWMLRRKLRYRDNAVVYLGLCADIKGACVCGPGTAYFACSSRVLRCNTQTSKPQVGHTGTRERGEVTPDTVQGFNSFLSNYHSSCVLCRSSSTYLKVRSYVSKSEIEIKATAACNHVQYMYNAQCFTQEWIASLNCGLCPLPSILQAKWLVRPFSNPPKIVLGQMGAD